MVNLISLPWYVKFFTQKMFEFFAWGHKKCQQVIFGQKRKIPNSYRLICSENIIWYTSQTTVDMWHSKRIFYFT